METDTQCIFCNVINGHLPTKKVYEDDLCIAILNTQPATVGHTLVIPKTHFKNYFETPDNVISHMATVSKKIGVALRTATKAEGLNIFVNTDPAGGQVIFHTHIHIVPRHPNDGLVLPHPPQDLSNEQTEELRAQIEKLL